MGFVKNCVQIKKFSCVYVKGKQDNVVNCRKERERMAEEKKTTNVKSKRLFHF